MTASQAQQPKAPPTNQPQATPQQVRKPPIEAGKFGLNLDSLSDLVRFAEYWVRSKANTSRKSVFSLEDAIVCLQAGAELGLSPVQSMNGVMIVNGVTSLWGDVMLGVCQRTPEFDHSAFEETVDDKGTAICKVKRRDGKLIVRTYGDADAKQAGLTGKAGSWQTNPKRMKQLRARAFALRDAFADKLRGMYTAEEAQDIAVDRLMAQIETGPSQAPQYEPESPAEHGPAEARERIRQLASEHNPETVNAALARAGFAAFREITSCIDLDKLGRLEDELHTAGLDKPEAPKTEDESAGTISPVAVGDALAEVRAGCEVLGGKLPKQRERLFCEIVGVSDPKKTSAVQPDGAGEAVTIVRHLLASDPAARPSASEDDWPTWQSQIKEARELARMG